MLTMPETTERIPMNLSSIWALITDSVVAWSDDYAPSMGAAIAYYTAFSIAPLLVIVIAIAGFFFGAEAAAGYLYAQLSGMVGADGAEALQGMVESASNTQEGVIATVIGTILLLLGATTVFAELQSDLDRIWKAPAATKPEGIWGLLRARILSLGLVVSVGFLMLVSLVLSAALAALSSWWGGFFEDFEWLLHAVDFIVSLTVVTLLFALMYKILPRVKIAWRDVWVGAFVTAVLFTLGKLLVGLYMAKAAIASSFGTAGSLAVLLIWVYYSAQIFLLGAEFTWAYAHRFGSRRGEAKPATAKEDGAKSIGTADARPPAPSHVPASASTTHPKPGRVLASTGRGMVLGATIGVILGSASLAPVRQFVRQFRRHA